MQQGGVGFFYWTLNDNSFRTGSLFNDWTGASAAKLLMLNATPSTVRHRAPSRPPSHAPPLSSLTALSPRRSRSEVKRSEVK